MYRVGLKPTVKWMFINTVWAECTLFNVTPVTIYKYYTIFSLTQLVCRLQHVSAYCKAIIRPSIELIDQLSTIMLARMGYHKLTGVFLLKYNLKTYEHLRLK
jgi:hypothetical protein